MATKSVLLTIVLGLASAAQAQAGHVQAPATPAIAIAVYNDADVGAQDLAKAERLAGNVLARAGVGVQWANRGGVWPTGSGCDQMKSGVICVSMRILRQGKSAGGDVFGMAFVDPGGIGQYIDVFYGRVASLGSERLDAAGVMGHVMAHEVGHLLLGVRAHSELGIMRPHWEGSELKRASMGNLLFTPEQAEQMRERIRATSARVTLAAVRE